MPFLPPSARIGYAHLRVTNLARSLGFYADSMGLHEIKRDGDSAWLSGDGHTTHLILTEQRGAIPKPARTVGLYHVAIRLPSRPALATVFRRLVMHHVPFQGFSDHLVSEALYLPDPDGNGLELYRDRPREEWTLDGDQVAMNTLPLNVENLLEDALDERWTGIAPGTDIGHVHLHVSDLNTAERFYVDTLGFEVMQRGYPGALFVAAGGYHHHLGLNIWAGKTPPPINAVGLIAFSVVVPDSQGYEDTLRRFDQAGIMVERGESEFTAADQDGSRVVVNQ
jgi:catechol 2,3-dioxygenase